MSKEIRIVLVGKTGVGKSSLGNSLLGKRMFYQKTAAASQTRSCEYQRNDIDNNTELLVVDTPGLFDTSIPNEEVINEIVQCIGLSAPGPHIFVFVLSVTRFTKEEFEAIEYLKATFGDKAIDHVIVVFTRKEDLDGEDGNPSSIDEYIENSPPDLKDLTKKICKGRFIAICNKKNNPSHNDDVKSVISLIKRTVKYNLGTFYTTAMFEKAQELINNEIKKIKDENPSIDEKDARDKAMEDIQNKTGFWLGFKSYIVSMLKSAGRAVNSQKFLQWLISL